MDVFPEILSQQDVILLIVTSILTAMMTAAMGIGGGVLLLAVMASVVPVAVLIPVHGLVQLGSNAHRASLVRQHIEWRLVRLFLCGALIGALLAAALVVQLPLTVIQLAVALFILLMVWGPAPRKRALSATGLVTVGGLTTLISMFVGATGPLVAAFVHRLAFDKYRTVATFSACMSVQHLLKLLVFGGLGFALSDWLPLILAMIAGGFLGTWIGVRLLGKMPAEQFRLVFKLLVSVLALRLIWQALMV